jgi:hypothetical protein
VDREVNDAAYEEMQQNWYMENIGEHADLADELAATLIEKTGDFDFPEAAPVDRSNHLAKTKLPAFSLLPDPVYEKLVDHPHLIGAKYALQDCQETFTDAVSLVKFLRESAGLEMAIAQSEEERQQRNEWRLRFVNKEVQEGELEENDESNPLTATLPAKGEPMHSFLRKPNPADVVMHPELALSPEQANPVTLLMEIHDEETISSLIEDYGGVTIAVQSFPHYRILDWIVTYG